MTRVCDAFISPFELSKQSVENLKYFGVTDVIAVPQVKNVDTSDQLISYFERILLDVKRLQSWGLETISTLGIRGRKPKRAGDSVFLRMVSLTQKHQLKSIGPIGILEDSQEDWDVFLKQVSIAEKLNLPIIVAAPDLLEVTTTYKMANALLAAEFPPSKCVFRVKDPILVEPLLNDGFCCAVSATIPKAIFAALLDVDGAKNRLQVCSNIDSNHQDLLLIPKIKDYLTHQTFSDSLLDRILYENSSTFYNF